MITCTLIDVVISTSRYTNRYVTTLVITSHRHKTRPISHLSTSSIERVIMSLLPQWSANAGNRTADVPPFTALQALSTANTPESVNFSSKKIFEQHNHHTNPHHAHDVIRFQTNRCTEKMQTVLTNLQWIVLNAAQQQRRAPTIRMPFAMPRVNVCAIQIHHYTSIMLKPKAPPSTTRITHDQQS